LDYSNEEQKNFGTYVIICLYIEERIISENKKLLSLITLEVEKKGAKKDMLKKSVKGKTHAYPQFYVLNEKE
jgi:hypothetical protein